MATLLTINKGKSLTLGFVFPDSYDMNRIKDVKVYVGSSVYPYSISGKTLTCQLTSEQTALLFGLTKIAIWVDDNMIGGDPIVLGDIQITSTNVATASQSVNEFFDLLFHLTITEDTIAIDSVFYNITKGDSAFAVWKQQPGNAGKTEQDYINFLQQPAIEAALTANTAATNATEAATNVNTVETNVETAENSRVTAENERTIAESARVTAENDRVIAESNRVTGEAGRVTAESGRESAESSRITAESGRVAAENDRATAENTRESNENTRQTNESTRQTNEITRQSNESTRQSNETTRQNNEATRQSQEASRVAAENQRVASGSIIASQTTPQTLGSSSARLTKLWATDIESTNIPTVGGVDLRTALGVTFPQYFDIKAKGDGSGVLQMNITVLYAGTATITGGLFYTDITGTSAGTTSISLVAGDNSIYMKTSSSATIFVPGLTKIRTGGTSGTNIPALSNILLSPLINYINISNIDNSVGGTLMIPPGCTYFQLTGSNIVSGTLTIPSSCTYFVLRGNNAVSGVLTIPSVCTNFALYGNNTVSGTLTIPNGITVFLLGGNNTVSGTLAIPSGCTSFECSGNNTVSGTLTIPSGCAYFVISGNNTVSYNLANTPDATKYIYLSSANGGNYTYNTSSGQKTWAQGMREVYVRPKAGVWTSAMTDALLIDLSSVTSWSTEKTIDLRGNCGARTSASSNAVSTLQNNGVTVLTN
jgi:hypothetical protein